MPQMLEHQLVFRLMRETASPDEGGDVMFSRRCIFFDGESRRKYTGWCGNDPAAAPRLGGAARAWRRRGRGRPRRAAGPRGAAPRRGRG